VLNNKFTPTRKNRDIARFFLVFFIILIYILIINVYINKGAL
jgi:hypothetical protein